MPDRFVRACLITNPRSGRGGVDLTDALAVLRGQGWEVSVREKRHGGDATELARKAVQQGCNVVVDCGGDGTLSEIIDGVVGTDVAVGTLPGGTANLWAHEAGISTRLRVAAIQLIGAERRRVDVGHVTVADAEVHGSTNTLSQHFLLVAGLGFDGAVMERVRKPLKNRIGPLAVGIAALEAAPRFRAVPVTVELDNVHWQGRISQIVLGNSRRYGSFTRVTPDAFVDDGLLDVCLITAAGPLSVTRQLTALALRKRPSPASSETYRAAAVTVRSQAVLPLELDGGVVDLDKLKPGAGGVAYRFTLMAQAVSMLVPRTYDGELFQPQRLSDAAAVAPLQPVTANGKQISANGHAASAAHARGKRKKWRLRVVAVGADSITGARLKSGRVVRVIVSPATTLERGDERGRLWGQLSALTAGDLIEVKGRRDGTSDTLLAHRVVLQPHAEAAASMR